MPNDTQQTATQSVFQGMLRNVQDGTWPVGAAIPSERSLINDYGVSRIAIREALSMLRGLGVLDVGHGRRTQVRKVDAETFAQFLPLLLASGGQRSFDQIFEVRLALETSCVFLAAKKRTPDDLKVLKGVLDEYRAAQASKRGDPSRADLEFHLEIARMTGNPLFPVLLESLSNFIAYAQKQSCKNDPVRQSRALASHEAIYEAIAAGDADWARAEMESHLRYSAARQLESPAAAIAE